jgi:hypothetical protein
MKLSTFLLSTLSLAQAPLLGQPVGSNQSFTDANWVSFGGLPGLNLPVSAVAFDASGQFYVAGRFTTAGEVKASGVARWNGNAWSALSSGIAGTINALTSDTAGNLYVGGMFTSAGQISAINIAKWDGSTWSALDAGVNGAINALVSDANGNLYVGGTFTLAGQISANHVAKWDGTTWSALGSGISSGGSVNALVLDTNGNLYAGGSFTAAGGVGATNIAKWNGTIWSTLGADLQPRSFPDIGAYSSVDALAFDGSGNLYVGGAFIAPGAVSAPNIAKWDGSTWSALGSGLSRAQYALDAVHALACDTNGNLYAGGDFIAAGGVNANYIAKWDGSTWSALGTGVNNYVWSLAVDTNGNLYAGGSFTAAGGIIANGIARWNGVAWSALGSGFSGGGWLPGAGALVFDTKGYLYAGGGFTLAGGVSANRVARWDGSAWSPLGTGIGEGDPVAKVNALVFDPQGNLYAGGNFATAGGLPATNIAKWDGSRWSVVGSGIGVPDVSPAVSALACDGSGHLYVAGRAAVGGIAEWDGSAWSALGSGMDGSLVTIALDVGGTLYAGGSFTSAGGVPANNIAKWNGIAWSALGSGVDYFVSTMAFDGSENLCIGGDFSFAGAKVSTYLAKALLSGPTPNQVLLGRTKGGTNIITYLGIPGAEYAIEVASSLTPPVKWIAQATNPASTANATTAGYVSFTNSNHQPQAFYRTRLVP